MSRFAVMDPETGDWVETTEEAIRLGVTLTREPDYLSPSEQARLTCTCGHRLSRHHERGCIDCGEPPTGFHAFQRQYHDQWTDAEYPPLTREPGLDVAARAFAEHVSAIACDHTGTGAGTHTGCPERLALDAALASEDRP